MAIRHYLVSAAFTAKSGNMNLGCSIISTKAPKKLTSKTVDTLIKMFSQSRECKKEEVVLLNVIELAK